MHPTSQLEQRRSPAAQVGTRDVVARAVHALGLTLALAAGACMRIYPDPDLPDVKVEWDGSQCPAGATVNFEAVPRGTLGGGASVASAPCVDGRAILPNVDRAKLEIIGKLVEAGGAVHSYGMSIVDTRDGRGEETYLYFPPSTFGRVRFTWDGSAGATCASTGATDLQIDFESDEVGVIPALERCEDLYPFTMAVPAGTYVLRAYAFAMVGRVAKAGPVANVVVTERGALTDLGAVPFAPCTNDCQD
ncbi:MAG: hypothetical protein R3B48_16225 [Kofleriaceae bacterium]